jgi:hypothetical protein
MKSRALAEGSDFFTPSQSYRTAGGVAAARRDAQSVGGHLLIFGLS